MSLAIPLAIGIFSFMVFIYVVAYMHDKKSHSGGGGKSKKSSPDMFMILGGLLGGFVLCYFMKNNNNLVESHCNDPNKHKL